jgi:hypothetical protein
VWINSALFKFTMMSKPNESPTTEFATPTAASEASAPTDHLSDAERRAALAKLGGLAAWTAPTMLTLLVSKRASAESFPDLPPF